MASERSDPAAGSALAAAGRPSRPSRSSWRAASAWARPRWSARSARSDRCAPRSSSAKRAAASTTPPGSRAKTHHHGGDGLRPDRHPEDLALYLFGTPGQDRFWFVWDELAMGALGARGPRRHPAAGGLLPLGGLLRAARHPVRGRGQLLRGHQGLRPRGRSGRPSTSTRACRCVLCDARRREDGKELLITLVEHAAGLADRRAQARTVSV